MKKPLVYAETVLMNMTYRLQLCKMCSAIKKMFWCYANIKVFLELYHILLISRIKLHLPNFLIKRAYCKTLLIKTLLISDLGHMLTHCELPYNFVYVGNMIPIHDCLCFENSGVSSTMYKKFYCSKSCDRKQLIYPSIFIISKSQQFIDTLYIYIYI